PASGCVNVDAAAVVRRGGAPSGAHSDIVHPELARLVLAAGRIA
ncbi:serine-threonine protein kinase, partial [Streptomyces sp. SID2955]|nr:serine-threonine protein kinase [Streptomyces sp. SID2955]